MDESVSGWKVAGGCLVLILLFVVICPLGCALGWYSEGVAVVQKEFGPREALRKYEWFKDASASIEAKSASLKVYESRFHDLIQSYEGKPRSTWSREDREQWNLWQSECAGIAASYNNLAADYNSQMAKINWRFANQGDLPNGASQTLPREFKPYLEAK